MLDTSEDNSRLSSQFAVLSSVERGMVVPSIETTLEERKEDEARLRPKLAEVLPKWPFNWDKRTPPCHIFVPPSALRMLQNLNSALTKASLNIIERWFLDYDAKFPERMPLTSAEERLLRVRSILHLESF